MKSWMLWIAIAAAVIVLIYAVVLSIVDNNNSEGVMPTQTPAQTPPPKTGPAPTAQTKTVLDVIVDASRERIKSGETIYVEGIFTGETIGNDNSYVRYFLLGQPDINWFVAAGVETKSPEYAGFRALKEGDRVVIKGNYDYYNVNWEAAVLNNCSLVR